MENGSRADYEFKSSTGERVRYGKGKNGDVSDDSDAESTQPKGGRLRSAAPKKSRVAKSHHSTGISSENVILYYQEVSKQLDAVEDSLDRHQQACKGSESLHSDLVDEFCQLSDSAADLFNHSSDQVAQQMDRLNSLQSAFIQVHREMSSKKVLKGKVLVELTERFKRSKSDLNDAIDRLRDLFAGCQSKYDELREANMRLQQETVETRQLLELEVDQDEIEGKINEATDQANSLGERYERIEASSERMNQEIDEINVKLEELKNEKQRREEQEERERQRRVEEERKAQEDAERREREDEERRLREEEERRYVEEMSRRNREKAEKRNIVVTKFETKETQDDFDQGVACIVEAPQYLMDKFTIVCEVTRDVPLMNILASGEEMISNVVRIELEEATSRKFDEPITVAIPMQQPVARSLVNYREPVIKNMQRDGTWAEMKTFVYENSPDGLKMVRCTIRQPTVLAVVLRLRKDQFVTSRKAATFASSVDSRHVISVFPSSFSSPCSIFLQIQPVETATLQDLRRMYEEESRDLISCSHILILKSTIALSKQFEISIPVPPSPNTKKRPQTAVAATTETDKTARPKTSVGRSDDDDEKLMLIAKEREDMDWEHIQELDQQHLKKKEVLTFSVNKMYSRVAVARMKSVPQTGLKTGKLFNKMDGLLRTRPIAVILRQAADDATNCLLHVVPADRKEKTVEKLQREGYETGPEPSEHRIKEGQAINISFRGNLEPVEIISKTMVFQCNFKTFSEFQVRVRDHFAQKSSPHYYGHCQLTTRGMVKKQMKKEEGKSRNEAPKFVEEEGDVPLAEVVIEVTKAEQEKPRPISRTKLFIREDEPLKEDILRAIAVELGDDWKLLARELGIKDSYVHAIIHNNVSQAQPSVEAAFEMLVLWFKGLPTATDKTGILMKGLTRCGRGEIAEWLDDQTSDYKKKRETSAKRTQMKTIFLDLANNDPLLGQWRQFCEAIAVPNKDVDHIDRSERRPQDKLYKCLEIWREQNPNAKVIILIRELRKLGFTNLADLTAKKAKIK